MSIEDLIKDASNQYNAAMTLNDLPTAQHYFKQVQSLQEELNRQMNQRVDAIHFDMNRMWVTSTSIDPAKVYLTQPGGVITVDSMSGWEAETEDTNAFKAQQELDKRRNLRLFIHHARLFCEKFPNWTMGPDPADPFNKVELKHKNGKYKMESCYPDNAVKLWGVSFDQEREDNNFKRRKGIPLGTFRTGPETVPTYTFFGWSIGMDDTPEWAKE